jgi:hypothetical protein
MADKDKKPTREQSILMASKGFRPALYEVLYDLPHTMIIRHIENKQPEIIYKD